MCVGVFVIRHVWSCLPSAGHGQDTAPIRDSHRWLWGLLSHPAAPHHHLRLRVEVSNPTSNTVCSGFSLLFLLIPFNSMASLLKNLQVHPLRALRYPHQLLPLHHMLQCPHSGRTDSGSQQGKALPQPIPASLSNLSESSLLWGLWKQRCH